jgi:hypothetical protein
MRLTTVHRYILAITAPRVLVHDWVEPWTPGYDLSTPERREEA